MTLGQLLTSNIKVTKHYPYRTAMVTHDKSLVLNGPYNHNDGVDRLHHHVAHQVRESGRPDNHECYQITIQDKTYYLMFSDWSYKLSTAIQVRNW
jgi:hypothetical protein